MHNLHDLSNSKRFIAIRIFVDPDFHAAMSLEIDPGSGYCHSNCTYYSKRKPVNFPQDEYLDISTFISSCPHSGRIALIDSATGETITYPHLWRSVRSLAAGLASLGIRKSDVILLLSPNSIHFPIICLAIMSIGAVVTTINPLNTAAEISKQATDSAAVLALVTPSLVHKLAATQLPMVLISSSSELPSQNGRDCISTLQELMLSNPAHAPSVRIRQDDTATLLYSSGTTGTSKGVISTHRNLISLVCLSLERLRLRCEYYGTQNEENSYLCTVPMFHIYGLSAFACWLLGAGSTVVVLSKFDPRAMLMSVQKYRVTHLPLVLPILLALIKTDISSKYDLSSINTVICGGATLSKECEEEFEARFPTVMLLKGYAMTETTGVGASADSEEESRHHGSVGMLAPNTEAKIVDPESGAPLPPNKRGELWLRGQFVMKGYFNNPEATASALDVHGWLRTGDLCYIDDEGYLFVVDRLKELIKYKGYQVAPAELEALLLSHPEISEAAVIPFPDKEAGQVPMAYIVQKPGKTVYETNVIDFVAQQVAPYKKVRRVAFVSKIPKTAAGKILRKDLIKLATSKL